MLEIVQASDWTRVDHWPWPNFTPAEMRCQGSGSILVNVNFMNKLQAIRVRFDAPIAILSGYRSPAHNAAITESQSMTGAHTFGRAVDVSLPGRERDVPRFLALAQKYGMTRVGLKLTAKNFKLHIDDMTAADGKAAREDGQLFCWTYA